MSLIKKKDQVKVMTGKNRGMSGKVLRVLPGENRLVVEGVNVRKVRERARRAGTKGQVVERPSPIDLSNVLLFCSSCKKGVRVGTRLVGKNKIRVCKKCAKEI